MPVQISPVSLINEATSYLIHTTNSIADDSEYLPMCGIDGSPIMYAFSDLRLLEGVIKGVDLIHVYVVGEYNEHYDIVTKKFLTHAAKENPRAHIYLSFVKDESSVLAGDIIQAFITPKKIDGVIRFNSKIITKSF